MSTFTLGTSVRGSDRPIGRLTGLVCDPVTDEVTDLVVNADDVPGSDRLVPIDVVDDGDDDEHLTLSVTRHEYFGFDTFETSRFVQRDDAGDIWHVPFELGDRTLTLASHERIPASEVALRRGTRVHDSEGRRIGRVHGFVVDPETDEITHLTLQHGHVFAHPDITIAVTDIDTITEEDIRLRVRKDEVAARSGASR